MKDVKYFQQFQKELLSNIDLQREFKEDPVKLAKTSPKQHKRLTNIWPRMACIGEVTSGTEVTKNSQCVEYIYNFMKLRTIWHLI